MLQQELVYAFHRIETDDEMMLLMLPEGTVEVVDEAEETFHHRYVKHTRKVVVRDENEENVQRLAYRIFVLQIKRDYCMYQFRSVLENDVHGLDNAAYTVATSEYIERKEPNDLLDGIALIRKQGNGIAGFVHLLQQNQK